jgi:hypothetical protein
MIIVNMTKAKEIKKNMIRAERASIFESLDVQFVRAMEAGDSDLQAEISAKKQALRDATKDPAIEAATTPEELKVVRPAALDAV